MTKYLRQNKKIKESGTDNALVYNFGIPAFRSKDGTKTCPNAGACAAGCYAKQGAYRWSNVANAYEERLALTKTDSFKLVIADEISKLLAKAQKQGKKLFIRIHDSGDFYSHEYLAKWVDIIDAFPWVTFYCYTKQIEMFKRVKNELPDNFKVCFSFGGKQDHLIDITTDRHSTVFANKAMLDHYQYTDASKNDLVAIESRCIGLVYHGAKAWRNTSWNRALTTIDSKYQEVN